jgi:hypothetical protein
MTKKETEIVNRYFHYREEESKCVRAQQDALDELKQYAPHKKGEIVTWTSNKDERMAVVTSIYPLVQSKYPGVRTVKYLYSVNVITKAGKLGRELAAPVDDDTFKWTGEFYKF